MKVTKIELQKNNKNRASVFCDEEYSFSVNVETLVKHGIKTGSELNKTEIENLEFESDGLTAVNKASEYVTKGLKTKKQIGEYLKNKGFSQQIITYAINKLEEYKLINDDAYIKAYVSDHSAYGELKLKQELMLKGVDKQLIEQYFAENYAVNLEKLTALKNKYLKNKQLTTENIIKCKKHLLSKGFTYEDINLLDWSETENWN